MILEMKLSCLFLLGFLSLTVIGIDSTPLVPLRPGVTWAMFQKRYGVSGFPPGRILTPVTNNTVSYYSHIHPLSGLNIPISISSS
jgi:hypothetical protein